MMDTIQLHCPGQVLPKANTATLHDRMQRFFVCGARGSAELMGGDSLTAGLRRIPLQVVVTCTDSLPANVAANALEQHQLLASRARDGPDAPVVGHIYSYCAHHQSCLASKPIVLSVPGVATGGGEILKCSFTLPPLLPPRVLGPLPPPLHYHFLSPASFVLCLLCCRIRRFPRHGSLGKCGKEQPLQSEIAAVCGFVGCQHANYFSG
ncbi:unnamed protein product [Symbiodinium sp. CCMP2592]|nr:unnamed protein product [Symbiodinium sp. CCMP2592]